MRARMGKLRHGPGSLSRMTAVRARGSRTGRLHFRAGACPSGLARPQRPGGRKDDRPGEAGGGGGKGHGEALHDGLGAGGSDVGRPDRHHHPRGNGAGPVQSPATVATTKTSGKDRGKIPVLPASSANEMNRGQNI